MWFHKTDDYNNALAQSLKLQYNGQINIVWTSFVSRVVWNLTVWGRIDRSGPQKIMLDDTINKQGCISSCGDFLAHDEAAKSTPADISELLNSLPSGNFGFTLKPQSASSACPSSMIWNTFWCPGVQQSSSAFIMALKSNELLASLKFPMKEHIGSAVHHW